MAGAVKPPLASPCIGACSINSASGIKECEGCKRTMDELRGWRTMTDNQRMLVWLRLMREGKLNSINRQWFPAGERT